MVSNYNKRHYHYFTKNWDPTLGDPTPVVKPLGEPKPVESGKVVSSIKTSKTKIEIF